MRRGGRHPAWPCIGAGRQLWLGRRFGHLMALGSQRRHGRDPVDPGFLDGVGPGAREPRFRDLGLPGDRRLTFTRTGKEHAYDLSLAPTVGFLVFTRPVAASLSRVVRTTVIDARPDGAGRLILHWNPTDVTLSFDTRLSLSRSPRSSSMRARIIGKSSAAWGRVTFPPFSSDSDVITRPRQLARSGSGRCFSDADHVGSPASISSFPDGEGGRTRCT